MPKKINLIGQKFDRLTVISEAPRHSGLIAWLCRCDCGNTIIATTKGLRKGHTKSCGCLRASRAAQLAQQKRTHGEKRTRLYRIWSSMKSRCLYPRNIGFARYGGRGIAVCDEWKNSFETFRDWARANGYADGLTLDRIDVNGNYEPTNCRWLSPKDQARNRRDNVRINGKCQSQLAEELGITSDVLYHRLKKGWSIEKATSTPLIAAKSSKQRSLVATKGK